MKHKQNLLEGNVEGVCPGLEPLVVEHHRDVASVQGEEEDRLVPKLKKFEKKTCEKKVIHTTLFVCLGGKNMKPPCDKEDGAIKILERFSFHFSKV